MKLHSNCLSGPKIKAFLKVYPVIKESLGDRSFHVDDAIRIVNLHPELEVRAYKTSKYNQPVKDFCERTGHTLLDMQNACHCFAARKESRVVDKQTGDSHQLLDQIENMVYRVRQTGPTVPGME